MKNKSNSIDIKKIRIPLVAGAVCILLITGAFLYYKTEENSIRRQKQNEIKSIADLKTGQIEQWLKERTGDAKVISESPFFIEGVRALLQNKNNPELKKEIVQKLVPVKTNYGYEAIFLFTPQGELLVSTEPEKNIIDSLTASKIRDAVNKRHIEFTDFYFCPTHNKIHYDIISPVMLNKNISLATLVFRINPHDYIYPLIQSWPVPSRTAETLIVRKDGDSVLFLNELRLQKNTALKLRIPLTEIKVPAVQAVLGLKGAFKGNDYKGNMVLSYSIKKAISHIMPILGSAKISLKKKVL